MMTGTLNLIFVDSVGIRVESLAHVVNIKNDKSQINRRNTQWNYEVFLILTHNDACAGNNYRKMLSKYETVLNNPICMYDAFCSMCEDNMVHHHSFKGFD